MEKTMNDRKLLASIQQFWFMWEGEQIAMRDNTQLWWQKQPQIDKQIYTTYHSLYLAELSGKLDTYTDAQDLLSRIILLDQFARNMFRDSPQAFFGDARARWLAYQILPSIDALHPLQQLFVLLTFEHSEALAEQHIALDALQRLHQQVDSEEGKRLFAGYANFAQQHLNVIARFGRFPHRNAVLQRPSSSEELAYLQKPGSGF